MVVWFDLFENRVFTRRFGDAGKAGIKRAMAAGSKVSVIIIT